MGLPGRGRPAAVREDLPRRLPVGLELAHDPRQARRVSRGIRRFRFRARRALRRRATSSGSSPTRASFAIAARSSRCATTRVAPRELVREFGSLAAYFWRFEPAAAKPAERDHARRARRQCRRRPKSVALSKDLKRRGFTFVGPTTSTRSCRRWGSSTTTSMACARSARRPTRRPRGTFARPRTGARSDAAASTRRCACRFRSCRR